jgi:RimJ/RimL family protein N-acetyltransferase
MIFNTERLSVQQYTLDDFEDFCDLNSDEEVMFYIRPVKSREQTHQFFLENLSQYIKDPAYGRWAVHNRLNSEFVGSFMLRPSSIVADQIELGYAFYKKHWGKGYATEAVLGGLGYAFGQLNLPMVIAITQLGNIASQNLLIKCGFFKENDLEDNGRRVNLFRKTKIING